MLWDTINEENAEIAMDCSSFQMPRNSGLTRGSGGAASRRLNMSNMDGGSGQALHEMSVDELSFYDDDNAATLQQADRNNYVASPPPLGGLLSPEGSPRRFQVIERSQAATAKFLPQTFGRQQKLQNNNNSNSSSNTATARHAAAGVAASGIAGGALMPAAAGKNFRMFHSLSSSGSMESSLMEDDYMELLEMESLEPLQDDSQSRLNFPTNLNSLISGRIKGASPAAAALASTTSAASTATTAIHISDDLLKTPEPMRRPSVRRCLSMTESNTQQIQPKTPELLREVQETAGHNNSQHSHNHHTTMSFSPRNYHNNNKLNNGAASAGTAATTTPCFKRPEPPSTANSPVQSKRYRGDEKENMHSLIVGLKATTTPTVMTTTAAAALGVAAVAVRCNKSETGSGGIPLRKCMSMNDAEIMTALARSECKDEPDLIGDFSKPFALPLIRGRHHDLKSISSETVARLLRGEFNDQVASYAVIDCRYPYEYDGGHIRGAQNLYTQEQIIDEFLTQQKTEQQQARTDASGGTKRSIVIFHCEFSSERGPKLSRFLRKNDRARNTNLYPTLDYPEIYLLHNGYKEFYETHAELCSPIAYRPMLEPSYSEAYRHFRAKSKSWNGDGLGGTTSRFKKPRSRLML